MLTLPTGSPASRQLLSSQRENPYQVKAYQRSQEAGCCYWSSPQTEIGNIQVRSGALSTNSLRCVSSRNGERTMRGRTRKSGDAASPCELKDIRGDLHAHSMSNDCVDMIEDMAEAAREHGYKYIGITDHSQSLKIARGTSADDLWAQIGFIDKLNANCASSESLNPVKWTFWPTGRLD
jgi:hypothetical protein